jgi:hypothetical protein
MGKHSRLNKKTNSNKIAVNQYTLTQSSLKAFQSQVASFPRVFPRDDWDQLLGRRYEDAGI